MVIFNFEKPIEAMFYTDFIVYRNLPSVGEIERLEEGWV